jgi:outer membrane protein assembly factor BamD (BamD/ComL family)
MGKNRARKRDHLFFYCACLLAFVLVATGCAPILNLQKKLQEQNRLESAEDLITEGSFEQALIENERIVNQFPVVPPGDTALFNVGYIYAHPDNPKRDYRKAFVSFHRLVRDFPDSDLRHKARVWALIIDELVRTDNKVKRLEATVDSLQEDVLEGQLEKNKLKVKDQTIRILKEQLRKFKEIDIVIEEQKRERLPEE